jgi:hypothetical protein
MMYSLDGLCGPRLTATSHSYTVGTEEEWMARNRRKLEGHVKRGGRFVPPLMDLDGVALRMFRRNALPDMRS